MAMLIGYFDESGTHAAAQGVTVAGFISPEHLWVKFQGEWEGTLAKKNLTDFRATDFESRIPPFDRLTDAERVPLQQALIARIRHRTQFSVAFTVNKVDYALLGPATLSKYPEMATIGAPSAYTWAVLNCLERVGDWCNFQGHDEPIAYVFEDGAGHNGEVYSLRDQILKIPELKARYRMGSLTFADKKAFNPLQSADMLAYETFKEFEAFYTTPNHPKRTVRRSYEALVKNRPHFDSYFADGSIHIVVSPSPGVPSGTIVGRLPG
jgi:hypothetical protein